MPRDLSTRYMDRFGCIGPDCEDHCCWGWKVLVDKNTYENIDQIGFLLYALLELEAALGRISVPVQPFF